jgi:branched-chain amino acid aminotransferase
MTPLAEFIWQDGELKPWAEAKVHVLSHAIHYGTSVFEGVRVYDTPDGPVGFRLTDHIRRLFDSARVYRMRLPFGEAELIEACREVVRANGLKAAYIRPVALMGPVGFQLAPPLEAMVPQVAIAAFPWGAYLGDEGLAKGVDVCVASWARLAPNTVPAGAKAGGNYLSSYLISREALDRGCAEGIGLGTDGRLSEGAGENLFLVRDGRLMTPPAASSVLMGITRDTAIKLASDLGYEVVEQTLPREALYFADEIFMTGTACEITPVRSVDGIETRSAGPGAVTRALDKAFRGLFDGTTEDRRGWLEPIEAGAYAEAAE